jgi:hypothetical protein
MEITTAKIKPYYDNPLEGVEYYQLDITNLPMKRREKAMNEV